MAERTELLRLIDDQIKAISLVQKELSIRMAERSGAVRTEDIDPNLGDEGSFGRLSAFSFADFPRDVAETGAFVGTVAPDVFAATPLGPITKAMYMMAPGENRLEKGIAAMETIGQGIENLPIVGAPAAAARLGRESEREAILGREGAGLGTKAGVLAVEALSDPTELAPGGIGLKALKTVGTAALASTIAARAAAKGVKSLAKKTVFSADDISRMASQGIKTGLREADEAIAAAQHETLNRGIDQLRAQANAEVKSIAAQSRAIARTMTDFPNAPTRFSQPLPGQEEALKEALRIERARSTRGMMAVPSERVVERAIDVPFSTIGKQKMGPLSTFSKEMAEGLEDTAKRADELSDAITKGEATEKTIPLRDGYGDIVDETGKVLEPKSWQERLANLWHADYNSFKTMATRRATGIRQVVRTAAKTRAAKEVYGPIAHSLGMSRNPVDAAMGRGWEELLDGDLLAIAEYTGNAMVGKDDTLAAVKARLSAVGADANPLIEEVKMFRKNADRIWANANDMNIKIGEKEIPYRDSWVHHSWRTDQKSAKFKEAKVKSDAEYGRDIPTYFRGVHQFGLEPRSLRFSDNAFTSEAHAARAMATKQAIATMAKINTVDVGKGAGVADAFVRVKDAKSLPAGYVQIEIPELRHHVEGVGSVMGMHKSLSKTVERLWTSRSFNEIDKILSTSKMSALAFSTFHGFTLGFESAPSLLGPIKGIKASARLGGGIPGLAPKMEGDQIFQRLGAMLQDEIDAGRVTGLNGIEGVADMTPEALRAAQTELGFSAIERSMKAGVVGEPVADTTRSAWVSTMTDVADWARRTGKKMSVPAGGKLVGDTLDIARVAQESINKGLWDGLHTPIKHFAFNSLYDGLLKVKRGEWGLTHPIKGVQKKLLKDLSDEEIASRVARVVNDEFGGQNWDSHIKGLTGVLSDPKVIDNLRRGMLSPDWLISSVRMSTAAFDVRDPVRLIAGARHWKNFGLGAALYANLTNAVFTSPQVAKLLGQEPAGPGGVPIVKDPLSRSFFHIRTPFRDKDTGEIVYLRWGKQFQEASPAFNLDVDLNRKDISFNFTPGDLAQTVGRKTTPIVSAMLRVIFPPADFPTPVQLAERKAQREGREITGAEWTGAFMKMMAEDVYTPFSFRETGMPLAPVAVARGIDIREAEMSLTDAYLDGDTEAIDSIMYKLSEAENLQPDVVWQIVDRAKRNADRRQGFFPAETEEQINERRRKPR